MRLLGVGAQVLALAAAVQSFPTAESLLRLARRGASPVDGELVDGLPLDDFEELQDALLRAKEKRLLFDPLTKPIDVTGSHAFRAPNLAGGDQRGPCPGLNALANHGYISRDGVVGFAELIAALNTVYGMGLDLSTILAVMGTVGVGNPLSLKPGFSIGGPSSKSSNILGNLLGLLGKPRGLVGSHNWIEADSSNTRDDLYVTGDASTMNMDLFLAAYNAVPGDVITMNDLAARAAKRFDESVATNPNFYYGPYTGLIARNAGYVFAGRLLSNHSKEFPGGQLTKEVFKSFFAVVTENGQLVYKPGHERIPANWYRTPVDYTLLALNLDIVNWVTQHPVLANIGGNLGRVNSFAGVDIGDVTGGVLNSAALLQGNNLMCLALEAVKTFAPNSLSSLFKVLEVPLGLVTDAVVGPLLSLHCPEFRDLKMDGTDFLGALLKKYPGAGRSGVAF